MPLTEFQRTVVELLASNRDPSSYLAGGAAQYLAPNSRRFSYDLDYFQDSVARVAEAFESDADLLDDHGVLVEVEISQPGFIRAQVSSERPSGPTSARVTVVVEWAHDTAWRFFPTVADPVAGFRLHEVDLAVNKVLALVGRNEPRDLVDTMVNDHEILQLGALVWAAAGKDPGYTPLGLLALLRRKRAPSQAELNRLHLVETIDPVELKTRWLEALDAAEAFVAGRPAGEVGCLYWDTVGERVVSSDLDRPEVVPHFGQLYGLVPTVLLSDSLPDEPRPS